MATTIAVLSQKGGTGKTTLTRTLSDVFGRLGLEVLAIDADPQGNLSDYFDTDPDAQPTLAEVLQGQVRAADAVHGAVIPANMRTKHARQTLEALRSRFGDRVCRSVIRQSIAYAESAERAIPILDYRPDRGADYLSLAGELLRRLGRYELLEPLDRLSAEVVPAGARA